MPKLLLADDSITIQKVVELVLAEEGFDIKAAGNGADALAMLASFTPDIILADIEMPKMNGYQFCERVKKDPATKNIPVILLAGAFEPLDDELAKNVGADDFLIKPFESEDLIGKVRSFLSAPAGKVEEAIEVAEAVEFEAGPAGEDLWGIEEITGAPAEEVFAEEAIEVMEAEAVEEDLMFAEAVPEAISIEEPLAAEEVFFEEPRKAEPKKAVAPKGPVSYEAPAMPAISAAEVMAAIKKAADERLREAIKGTELKDAIAANLSAGLKDTIEKILWEMAPELVEKMVKESLRGAMATITKEVEKVVWETVPDLAETIIKKEIENIKAGL